MPYHPIPCLITACHYLVVSHSHIFCSTWCFSGESNGNVYSMSLSLSVMMARDYPSLLPSMHSAIKRVTQIRTHTRARKGKLISAVECISQRSAVILHSKWLSKVGWSILRCFPFFYANLVSPEFCPSHIQGPNTRPSDQYFFTNSPFIVDTLCSLCWPQFIRKSAKELQNCVDLLPSHGFKCVFSC